MKWLTAMILGAILGFILPMVFGGPSGVWTSSWAGPGTVRPFADQPGLLFSIPVFVAATIIFRMFFNWHNR